jgi:hypothetical protein
MADSKHGGRSNIHRHRHGDRLVSNAPDRVANRWPTAPASTTKYTLLHPADANAHAGLTTVNLVREIPSPGAVAPPVLADDPIELAVDEKPIVEEPKIEPAPARAKETQVSGLDRAAESDPLRLEAGSKFRSAAGRSPCSTIRLG